MATTNDENTFILYLAKIIHEREFVDLKPYSHNIISITLRLIADKWGTERANQTIEYVKLEELGWHKEIENKKVKKGKKVRKIKINK